MSTKPTATTSRLSKLPNHKPKGVSKDGGARRQVLISEHDAVRAAKIDARKVLKRHSEAIREALKKST